MDNKPQGAQDRPSLQKATTSRDDIAQGREFVFNPQGHAQSGFKA